jgi:hypothetical protein
MTNYEDQDEGVDTGVSDDAFEQDPVLGEHQTEKEQKHWIAELEAARKERKKFDTLAAATIKRYADERSDADKAARYNVFFAVTDIKQAGLYARTPVPSVKRRFNDSEDDVSRVGATMQQRAISYELECGDFNQTVKQIIFDRLVPGIGIGWARLEQEESEQQPPPVQDPQTGALVQPPAQTVVTHQLAEIDYVSWKDFIWAPSQVWALCPWIGRRVPMTKKAVEERFGDTAPRETLSMLSYEKSKEADNRQGMSNLGPQHTTESTVDVYELWDKNRKLIFWVAESANVPLDVQGDTNEFPDFYPTPLPPLGRFTTAKTLPISDFSLLQDLYNELDYLNNRRANLGRAIKLKFMYDGANPELKDLFLDTEELEGVPVKNMAELNEKGGLEGAIKFAPLGDIVGAYQQTMAAIEGVKAQIYEVEGINDMMRSEAMPYESAQATSTKTQFGMSRLAVMQREVADYIAELLRLKAHLQCRFYEPQTWAKLVGVLPAPDMLLVPQALALLKDTKASHYRISVSTDSIQLPNWNQEKADKTAAVQALSNLLPQLVQATEKVPEMGGFGAQTIKWLITGFKGSEEIEGYLDTVLKQLADKQRAQQGQPPKPTPEQIEAQQAQMEQQTELLKTKMKGEIDVQVASIQAQAKVQAAAMQAEVDSAKARVKEMEAAYEARFREMELRIDATRAAHENAVDIANLARGG